MCHRPSTCTMNGSATKRAGTSVTPAAEITGLEAPGAAFMRKGDAPEYMAMDHIQGRLASLERCPTALGSMLSMRTIILAIWWVSGLIEPEFKKAVEARNNISAFPLTH